MLFKKKSFDYFEALIKMSECALEEANLLKEIFEHYNFDTLNEERRRIHAIEHRCDEEKHVLTTELAKEFLPPIERDDLFHLSHVADNLTDCMDDVIMFLYMAGIKTIRPDSINFLDLIIKSCENVVLLFKEFRNFKKPEKLKELIIVLNDIEEQGDRLYTEAVRKLSLESKDTLEIIEWRDIYRNFENCFDAAESIADNIEMIILKNS